ncbi:MAG: CARDB domain-containing protein, partial [Pseudomonas marincola]
LNGTFKASEPGMEIEFHYEDDNGVKSSTYAATANALGTGAFSHEYGAPYNADGPVSGWIKIVGDSHEFSSAPWNYELNCARPAPTKFKVENPPSIKVDYVKLENYVVMSDKRYCPTKAIVYGVVSTNGSPFTGNASLQVKIDGQNKYSGAQALNIGANVNWPVMHTVDLDWSSQGSESATYATNNATGPTSKTIFGKLILYNSEMTPIQPAMAFAPLNIGCTMEFASVQSNTAASPKGKSNTYGSSATSKSAAPSTAIPKTSRTSPSTSTKAVTRSTTAKVARLVLPDLVVKSASHDGKGSWKIKIANIGQANASATTVRLVLENRKSITGKVGALKKGQTKSITVKTGSRLKVTSISIDPTRKVQEINERNNRLKL